ncbi:hypothetical protein PtrM4_095600 [Pyrenophora tritici-repentis]|uniref:Uncharacterized protein n=1 Tax=Pyrenophora tritici-repentis TaxID=45151 RepID=A0A834RYG2_9PLEO|nr:hypothetical protein PtrM4_095600 [Pyrenophora tritici-repentis]KAI1517062.1 hypothetical protein Ptr86124_003999 [Pyrenophora tritici-repentis]
MFKKNQNLEKTFSIGSRATVTLPNNMKFLARDRTVSETGFWNLIHTSPG